uniref:Aspartate aminotransferase-like enzyme n=1 Tax=Methanococcus maripaludis (strain C6 / ATCC BAA-1332) TaxID=444158 RepID=A9A8V0_METM6
MIIPHRKPCIESEIRTSGNPDELKRIINDLLFFEKEINILPSGNSAIHIASIIVSKLNPNSKTLIPDMGGWKGFETYSKLSGLNVETLKTDLGVVNTEFLEEKIKESGVKSLFLTSLAGYLAEQPLEEIAKICKENDCFFIEDVSGKIGGKCGYGDMIVCSTGSPKIINCEYGGFLGISKETNENLKDINLKEDIKNILKTYKMPDIYGKLIEETLISKKSYNFCVKFSNIIKENMENAYFMDSNGVSVFLEYENPKEIAKNIDKLVKLDNGKSIVTLCPLYERILRKGIVLEIKKMDVHNISEDEIYEVLNFLKK